MIVEKVVCEISAENGYDRQGARMGLHMPKYLISSSACSTFFLFFLPRCDDGIAHELSFERDIVRESCRVGFA